MDENYRVLKSRHYLIIFFSSCDELMVLKGIGLFKTLPLIFAMGSLYSVSE
jgi:hypothetical protein